MSKMTIFISDAGGSVVFKNILNYKVYFRKINKG